MSSYTRTHSGSPSGSYFPLDPSSHADEPPRHHRGLTRSITNSSFRSFRTFAGGAGQGISEDQYRVLLELQRLLYHGPGGTTFLEGDDASGDDRTESRKDQLRMFVNEHFESDCRESIPASQREAILIFRSVYESPLVTLQSRPILLDAISLTTDLANGTLPSLWPRAIVSHVKSALSWSVGKVLSLGRRLPAKDPERGDAEGHPVAVRDLLSALLGAGEDTNDAWWDAWRLGSECTEVGGFETYDGYHLGVIDQ